MLVQDFVVKHILEDHLAGPGDEAPSAAFRDASALSGKLTFLFGIYYLQHVINTRLATEPAR